MCEMFLKALIFFVCSGCVCYASDYFTLGQNYHVEYTTADVTEERIVRSRRHCIQLCQSSGCRAANYDPVTYQCQLLNSAVTRILPQTGPAALYRKGPLVAEQVGMWPLNDLYQGKNLVLGKTDITLYDVTFPDMSSAWMTPPARFSGTSASYGQFNEIADVKLSGSFAFIAAVYTEVASPEVPLLEWSAGAGHSVHIWIHKNQLFVNLVCGNPILYYGVLLNNNQWYTMALSYDQDTNVLSWWMDGVLKQVTNACASTPGFSTAAYAYVNYRPGTDSTYRITGRITCLGLYDTTMTYEEMTATTTPHCQLH